MSPLCDPFLCFRSRSHAPASPASRPPPPSKGGRLGAEVAATERPASAADGAPAAIAPTARNRLAPFVRMDKKVLALADGDRVRRLEGAVDDILISRPIRRGKHAKMRVGVRLSDGTPLAVRGVRVSFEPLGALVHRHSVHHTRPADFLADGIRLRRIESPMAPRAIYRIYKNGVDAARWAMPMPLMDRDLGGAAGDVMARLGDRRTAGACYVLRGLAEGLARLADEAIVHRDLKPENVFLKGGKLYIGDLGLATPPGLKVFPHGARQFASPEQHRFFSWLSDRADVWSAALIVANLLTRLPFPKSFFGARAAHAYFRRWRLEYEARRARDDRRPLESGYPAFDRFLAALEAESPALADLLLDMLHPIAALRPSARMVLERLAHPALHLSAEDEAAVSAVFARIGREADIEAELAHLETQRRALREPPAVA